jgi:hypothetical protein
MSSRNLARRLEGLEAELTPRERVLKIEVEFIGQRERNRTLELRMPEPSRRPRRWWQQENYLR